MENSENERFRQLLSKVYLPAHTEADHVKRRDELYQLLGEIENSPDFHATTKSYLKLRLSHYYLATTNDYIPPELPEPNSYAPLEYKAIFASIDDRLKESIGWYWMHSGYVPMTTFQFTLEMARLADAASLIEDYELSYYAAKICLDHRKLLDLAKHHIETPVGQNSISKIHLPRTIEWNTFLMYPIIAADNGLQFHDDYRDFWASLLLEFYVRWPINLNNDKVYSHLKKFYNSLNQLDKSELLDNIEAKSNSMSTEEIMQIIKS